MQGNADSTRPRGPNDGGLRDHFRREARPLRRLPVRYALVEGGRRGRARAGHTRNVGVGGAFIETAHPPAPGTVLSVELQVAPRGPTLSLAAEVRWVSERLRPAPGMGVRFDGVGTDQRARLAELLASLTEAVDHDELP